MAGLLTLTEVKDWLSITKPDYDGILTIINDAMCVAVTNYTGHSFALVVEPNEILDATQSDLIVPRNSPIISVQNLYFYTQPDGTDGTLIDPTSYLVLPESIVLQNITTPFNRARISLAYTWGYDGLPADVRLMMLQAVEAEYRRRGQKSLGVSSRSKKDESQSFADGGSEYWDRASGLPTELVNKLQFYKQNFEWPSIPMATRNL